MATVTNIEQRRYDPSGLSPRAQELVRRIFMPAADPKHQKRHREQRHVGRAEAVTGDDRREGWIGVNESTECLKHACCREVSVVLAKPGVHGPSGRAAAGCRLRLRIHRDQEPVATRG